MRMPSVSSQIIKVVYALIVISAAINSVHADAGVYRRTLSGTVLVLADGSAGTGVLIDRPNRLVVTCNHVAGQSEKAVIFFPIFADGRLVSDPSAYAAQRERNSLNATVVMRSPRQDLALLQLERLPETVQAVPLAMRDLDPGEEICTIGNSGIDGAALWRYSTGTVRQSYFKQLRVDDAWIETTVLETQLPISSGDSGGPILNSEGELVALSMTASDPQNSICLGIDVREIQSMHARYLLERSKARQQVTELFLPPHPSRESVEESQVLINNHLSEPVSLIWMDENSVLHEYGTVSPGQIFRVDSRVGHVWIIRLADGTNAGCFEATSGGTTVDVNPPLLSRVTRKTPGAASESLVSSPSAAADAALQATLTGRLWSTPILLPGEQVTSGHWVSQFRADGTFTELTVNTERVVVDQREGRYFLNGNLLTMVSGDQLHWKGRVIGHNSESISFVYPDGRTATAIAINSLSQTGEPHMNSATAASAIVSSCNETWRSCQGF